MNAKVGGPYLVVQSLASRPLRRHHVSNIRQDSRHSTNFDLLETVTVESLSEAGQHQVAKSILHSRLPSFASKAVVEQAPEAWG